MNGTTLYNLIEFVKSNCQVDNFTVDKDFKMVFEYHDCDVEHWQYNINQDNGVNTIDLNVLLEEMKTIELLESRDN